MRWHGVRVHFDNLSGARRTKRRTRLAHLDKKCGTNHAHFRCAFSNLQPCHVPAGALLHEPKQAPVARLDQQRLEEERAQAYRCAQAAYRMCCHCLVLCARAPLLAKDSVRHLPEDASSRTQQQQLYSLGARKQTFSLALHLRDRRFAPLFRSPNLHTPSAVEPLLLAPEPPEPPATASPPLSARSLGPAHRLARSCLSSPAVLVTPQV